MKWAKYNMDKLYATIVLKYAKTRWGRRLILPGEKVRPVLIPQDKAEKFANISISITQQSISKQQANFLLDIMAAADCNQLPQAPKYKYHTSTSEHKTLRF